MHLLRLIPPCFLFISTSAMAAVPTVLTDMPVTQSLVAQVMGDLGRPEVLLGQGSDVHSFQLRPSQARHLAEADILFWVGHELTPWLEAAVEGVGMQGRSIELLDTPGVDLRRYADEGHEGHDDHDDPSAAQPEGAGAQGDADHGQEEHAHEEHAHEGSDPHAWLDPDNARAWLDAIAIALSAQDPENAATYAANAEQAKAGVSRLEAEVKDLLAPVGAAPLLVYHDAYGYFSGHFGVNIVGELELGNAGAPSAERLAGVRTLLTEQGAVCILPEAQHDPKLLQSVVEGTDVRIGRAVDPEGSTLDYGPGLYGALLTGLARAIADCVQAKG